MNKYVKKTIRMGIWLSSLAILVYGCDKKKVSPTLAALVGQDTIRVSALTEAYEQTQHLFKSAEEELAEKKKLLELLIEERLLIQEAYSQKIERDNAVLGYEKIQNPLFLIDLLYFREVRDKVRLSDRELRELYGALKNDRCLKMILHHDKKVARYLADRLGKGEKVDSLIRVHSEDASRHRGGDIGCYGWFNPPDQHFESILKLSPGGWVGPINHEKGWAILYCAGFQAAELPPFEKIAPDLRTRIEAEREKVRSAQFVREVRSALNFRLVDSAVFLANTKQQKLSEWRAPDGKILFSSRIRTEELAPAEREMPLAVYDGGKITLLQLLEGMQGTIPASRMTLDTTETTRAVLFQFVFQRALVDLARKQGLDQNPDYLRRLRHAVEGQMALMVKNRILQQAQVDSVLVHAYFTTHPEEFVEPAAFHVLEINRPSDQDLNRLKSGLKSRADFESAASQMTAREQLKPLGGDLGWVQQFQFPELFGAAATMKKGQIVGPIRLADGSFSLIYLNDNRPERRLKFAEVRLPLAQQLLAQKQDSVFNAWLEARKPKTTVIVFPENLQRTIDYERYTRLKKEEAKRPGGSS